MHLRGHFDSTAHLRRIAGLRADEGIGPYSSKLPFEKGAVTK